MARPGSLTAMQDNVCYRHPDEPTGIACQRCHRPICHRCMVAGSVGFQCPSCVEMGRRQTRQGQLPYGGVQSSHPALTSQVLIGINLLIWAVIFFTGGSQSPLVRLLAIRGRGWCLVNDAYLVPVNASQCTGGDVWVDGVATGAWWQVITNAFVHADILHIAFNMAALFILGPQLEGVLGRVRFLTVYLVSALAASAVVLWFTEPYVTTLGASGAIFGMMGAVLVIVRKHRGDLRPILVWVGLNVVITVIGASQISWQGHLGGLVGGLAVTAALLGLPRERRERWQWPLVGLVVVVISAAMIVRVLQLA